MSTKAKIIATIGPASNNRKTLERMAKAGMNVARLNCSHGTHETHGEVIGLIRSISRTMNKSIGILLDLQGPKIRVGKIQGDETLELEKGADFAITTRKVKGSKEMVSTTYDRLPSDVQPDDTILLDDGLIELKALSKTIDTVQCKVINGGPLKQHKGINLPGVDVSAPSLTQKDIRDVKFGIQQKVDYFALSFVRSAEDLKGIKALIKKQGSDIPVIAKIEKPEAVKSIDPILETSDGIMVARGDLGVEMKPELVPTIQKQIIKAAMAANKPVITATQMLETMTHNPIPTRAEASDVANAIFDGTDAVMLSGETASGRYPVRTIKMMAKITRQAERSAFLKYNIHFEKDPGDLITHAVAQSAVNILHEVNAKAIVVFSVSGRTAKQVSKQRPLQPIYAFSPRQYTYNRLSLIWGVRPLFIPELQGTTRLALAGERLLLEKELVKQDDLIVLIIGRGLKEGSTNIIKIHRIGHED